MTSTPLIVAVFLVLCGVALGLERREGNNFLVIPRASPSDSACTAQAGTSVSAVYNVSQIISITTRLGNQGGIIELSLLVPLANNQVESYKLELANNAVATCGSHAIDSKTQWCVPPFDHGQKYAIDFQLPANVACDKCVLQAHWVQDNSLELWNCAPISISSTGPFENNERRPPTPSWDGKNITSQGKRDASGVLYLLNQNGNWYQKPTACANTEHGYIENIGWDFESMQVFNFESAYSCCLAYIYFYELPNCAGASEPWLIATYESGVAYNPNLLWYEPYDPDTGNIGTLWWTGADFAANSGCECL